MIASRLAVRLIAIQIIAALVTHLVVVAFSPRLLLLDDAAVSGAYGTALWSAAAHATLVVGITLALFRPLRGALRALAVGSDAIEAADVVKLYSIPARLVGYDLMTAMAIASLALLPPLRPAQNDLYTQFAGLVLTMTMVSAATLPAYVTMRASVGRVLELVPYSVARAAAGLVEVSGSRRGGLRVRVTLAVVAPVAFVALGASLLVYAHARAADGAAREKHAVALAQGLFESTATEGPAREAAILEAEKRGYKVRLDETGDVTAPSKMAHGDDGRTSADVPLEAGRAVVVFETTRLSPVTGVYVFLAIVASVLAGLLGARLGAFFYQDIALANGEIRAMGVAEAMRGTLFQREARFTQVHELMLAIDDLGGVFREFGAAQERAIDARGATERMRALFLASMSHDLKGPLNAILGFAELVGRSRLYDGQRESLAIIEQRGRELLVLIETILDSARVEAGELEVSPEWTMVGDLVMSAVLEARDLAVGTHVQIAAEIQPGVPRLLVDATRVVQALQGVIMTAVRFTAEGGVVNVRATVPAGTGRLQIDVETSWRGLPEVEREKLFEAFKDADRARKYGSLGLGLSLARSIVEIHGGTIDAELAEGGGIVFRVKLPVGGDAGSIRERARSRASLPDLGAPEEEEATKTLVDETARHFALGDGDK
jgi:signal transduction histidine kinase